MTLQEKVNHQIELRVKQTELMHQKTGVRRFGNKLALPESTLEGSFTDTINEIDAEIAAIELQLIPVEELQKAAEDNGI